MNLCVNMLIEWLREDADPLIERVLWLDQSGKNVVTIDIGLKNTKALPRLRTREEIELVYASGGIRTLDTDPFAKLERSDAKIPADQREDREVAWKIIEPMVNDMETGQLDKTGKIFDPKIRGPLIAACGKRKKIVYKYLRRFWQGGQTKNALLPYFSNCGGGGNEREKYKSKPGRPSPLARVSEKPVGIVIDATAREYLRRGIKTLYLSGKAIVEQNFRLMNDQVIHWSPGAVYRPRDRGRKDYRLDACLDLDQFRQLMILSVLRHNTHHRMKWYRLDEFAIADHVEKYPIDLWRWGICNRSGHLQTRDLEIVRSNLLPGGEASVTEQGIYFKGVWYTCERAIREQWYVRARQQGRKKVPVVYDPRKTDIIYLVRDHGQEPEPCFMLDRDKPTYEGLDWQEVEDHFELQKQAEEASRTRELRAEAEFHAQAEHTMREAEEITKKAVQGLSKSAHLGNIRENRKSERDDERQEKTRAFAPVEAAERRETTSTRARKDRQQSGNKSYIPPAQPIDDIRQQREAKLRNSHKEQTNGQ